MKFIIRRFKGIIIAIKGMFFLLKNEEAIKVQSFIFLIYLSYSMIKTDIKNGWTTGHKSGSTIHTIKKSESPIYFYL